MVRWFYEHIQTVYIHALGTRRTRCRRRRARGRLYDDGRGKGVHLGRLLLQREQYYVCEQSALPLINVQTQQTQSPPQQTQSPPQQTQSPPQQTQSPPQQTQSPPKQTSAASCPSGWIMNHGSCYFFHTDDRYKWRNANSFCSAHQAHLAIIETAEEDHFLKQQSSQRIHEHGDSDSGVWVGGSDDDNEGHWEWIDGFSHTSKPMQGYTNWYPGEPDSGDGEHGEDCMCMIGEKGFQWQDYHCGKHMFFICEKSTTFAAPLVG
ncbi:C-type lectin domain family 4 member F-like isoform X2 [Mercenaria mercenaria]|uniref:C-type lectin domain family 4 member F-like isoform X2 n=1 Tax=Mercenaria mercenaria TaxID=6596 RepID=UPI00234ED2D5|nr:C-type lectin domain family 4 member F-like isoform X2 [Mercenaria mercenaria]